MNVKQNQKGLTVIDYLKVRFEAKPHLLKQIQTFRKQKQQVQINENLLIVFDKGVNSPDYQNKDAIYHREAFIASLYHGNRHNKADKAVTVFFANHLFYSGEWHRFYKILKRELNLTGPNVSRLDIAHDSPDINLLERIHQIKTSSRLKIKLETSLKTYKPTYKSNKLDEVLLSTPKSDRYIKIYNKTNEIEAKNKPYIRDWWKANGIRETNNVERFELRLQRNATRNIDVESLTDSQYLETILSSETAKRFKLVREQRRQGKIKKIDVTPFNFKASESIKYNPIRYERKASDTITDRTIKTTLKTLYLLYLDAEQAEDKENFLQSIQKINRGFSLQEYYKTHFPFWEKERAKAAPAN